VTSPLVLSSLAEGSKPVAFACDHRGDEVGEGGPLCADSNEVLEREV
jgi:hypothetical protein